MTLSNSCWRRKNIVFKHVFQKCQVSVGERKNRSSLDVPYLRLATFCCFIFSKFHKRNVCWWFLESLLSGPHIQTYSICNLFRSGTEYPCIRGPFREPLENRKKIARTKNNNIIVQNWVQLLFNKCVCERKLFFVSFLKNNSSFENIFEQKQNTYPVGKQKKLSKLDAGDILASAVQQQRVCDFR